MKTEILNTLEHSKNLIISPDMDGFMSADMNRQEFVSLGNHMRLIEDGMSVESFNPNVHFDVTTYSDKFPFATAFLISFAIEADLSEQDLIRMAFADSTLKNMEKYSDNMRNWSTRMEHPATKYIIDNSDIARDNDRDARFEYVDQAFVSKRYGKQRYLDTLNNALQGQGMKFEPLTRGSKYICDKVGKETLIRYNRDIISYAEIFTGEYSVTYDQEKEWT